MCASEDRVAGEQTQKMNEPMTARRGRSRTEENGTLNAIYLDAYIISSMVPIKHFMSLYYSGRHASLSPAGAGARESCQHGN